LKPAEAAGQPLLDLVRRQVDLGPRYPGSEAHLRLSRELGKHLQKHAAEVHRQPFTAQLPGGQVECANLTGIFRPVRSSGAGLARPAGPPLLLGTHFDTRLTADCERDPKLRAQPIPGANDGGSGTAILLSLLPELARLSAAQELDREVRVVFFDAEDVGGIGNLPFSLGAWRYAREPPFPPPGEVLVLDMVGGKGLELDLDGHCLDHPASLELTRRVFAAGRLKDAAAFRGAKVKRVICDHYPFLWSGIASCLLIDLDYPEWHTQADLPAAMSERSLATIAAAVLRFLQEPRR
jgi:Zn-dependent M28 family amino/carboxypeptidase